MRDKQRLIAMAILLAALVAINWIERPVPVRGEGMRDVEGLLDRSDRQSKHMVVPRFHGNEAARETANIYHSRKYQARLHKEIGRLKARLFPDSVTAQEDASSVKAGEKTFLLQDERIYLFISSSMPISTLRNYAADMDKLKDPQISMVMKGFVGGMHYIKPTIKFIEKILVKDLTCDASISQGERRSHPPKCEVYNATVNVDPLLYSRYGIRSVPAILYIRGLHSTDPQQSEGITDNTSVSDVYMVSGDVSLEYALDTIRKASKSSQVEGILKELRRSFY
ncbi:MAG: type-F conjugative transfer system pilin assembly protein TrbC [Desulfatiglandaceae bacterium]